MDIGELKDLLLKRLYIELQLFKDSVLRQTKEEVYGSSYKIEAYVNFYEILLEETGQMDEGTVRGLLYLGFGILDFLYQEWLTREDGVYDELKSYVGSGLAAALQAGRPSCGKDGNDGTELNQAA